MPVPDLPLLSNSTGGADRSVLAGAAVSVVGHASAIGAFILLSIKETSGQRGLAEAVTPSVSFGAALGLQPG